MDLRSGRSGKTRPPIFYEKTERTTTMANRTTAELFEWIGSQECEQRFRAWSAKWHRALWCTERAKADCAVSLDIPLSDAKLLIRAAEQVERRKDRAKKIQNRD
jgi:hypothetical protein